MALRKLFFPLKEVETSGRDSDKILINPGVYSVGVDGEV